MIVIIGSTNHGKSTLATTLNILDKKNQYVDVNTQELIEIMKKQEEREKKEMILANPTPNRETRRGNKKLKSWQWNNGFKKK